MSEKKATLGEIAFNAYRKSANMQWEWCELRSDLQSAWMDAAAAAVQAFLSDIQPSQEKGTK